MGYGIEPDYRVHGARFKQYDKCVLFTKNRNAKEVFDELAFSHKKEYVEWITGAKKEETRTARLEKTIEKLTSGKRNPSEK